MVDISDDTKPARRHVEVTSVVRRRRWTDEEKGRIVAAAGIHPPKTADLGVAADVGNG
jgi:hypothetical protein